MWAKKRNSILKTDWLNDFNDMSNRLELFYAERLGKCIHCTLTRPFFCTQLHDIFLSNTNNLLTSIWFINVILKGTIIAGLWSNGNEGVLHTSQIFRTGASLSDAIEYHTQDTPFGGSFTPLQRIQAAYSKHHRHGNFIKIKRNKSMLTIIQLGIISPSQSNWFPNFSEWGCSRLGSP